MITFYAWIVLTNGSLASMICGKIVKKGYGVSQLSRDEGMLFVGNKDNPSRLMAIRLDIQSPKTVDSASADLYDALDDLKIQHHGYIVMEAQPNCRWVGSNISLKEAADVKNKKRQQATHLRLVPPPPPSEPEKPEDNSTA